MNFERTEEQQMLADQVKRLMEEQASPDRLRELIDSGSEWDEALWAALAEMGLLGAAIPEEFGGLGMSRLDQAVISECLGSAPAPVPFHSSVVLAGEALILAGSQDQQSRYLPGIASGETIATLAYSEGGNNWSAGSFAAKYSDGRLNGFKDPVADAGIASVVIVVAEENGAPVLVLVDPGAAGITKTRLRSFDELRAHYRLDFADAAAEKLTGANAADILGTLFDRAAVQAAFEAVGGAERCLRMARDYAMERQIFGRPLASYQAIKHKLADIATAIELARSTALNAGWCADNDLAGLGYAASAARLTAIAAYEPAARENIQVHGGIGYTFEANCHFHYRRERTVSLSLGGREYWADRLLANRVNKAAAADVSAEDTPEQAAYRAAAKAWLKANAPEFEKPKQGKWTDHEEVAMGRAWQKRLKEGGYAGILLPEKVGGRGGTFMEALIFSEEVAEYNLPTGPYLGIGLGMALPVIAKHGTPEQIERYASATLRGEMTWCQLFSEPSAGSDLANLRTRAVRDGDDWIVNGQKVWSSWAHHADQGILITRTDPSLPKHKGLTFFVLDMKTPGIEVRPIRQISGESDFNETFFTDVRIPDSCRLGEVGEGWACAMTVLMGERLNQGGNHGDDGGIAALVRFAEETDRNGARAIDSAHVRTQLAAWLAEEEAEIHFQSRLRGMVARGENPGALAAMVKLAFASRYQKSAGFAMEMRGQSAIGYAADDSESHRIWFDYIWATALRVAGGADEVLRNQISERVLDMPGEIRADKNVPFDQLK